ncbi:methylglyoxal synthase [Desulfovibrio inopinatus]|uniref:methylglyoxal synthase n=1 Tax=Desulfovibrio inopinatus TaxID=102109 RepID=UPI0004241315|nr:methylglyoxal synthase [Desulfovibrio inopinatus]
MKKRKTIAVVAHDNCKKELLEWASVNIDILVRHKLVATGTTGAHVERLLRETESLSGQQDEFPSVHKLKSGPLGGDQQMGALISEGKIDLLFFFWDPMQPHPHDVDVKALLRLAVLYNIPTACNRSSADFLISSPLIDGEYELKQDDFSTYIERTVET